MPGKHENTFCIILQGGTHTMKEIIQGFYQKKHFWTRLILVIAAVILMGFALSWLLLVDLGTDPCTLLNQTISTRLGISIGNWQALFNTVLLIFVIIFGGRNLGFGTLANMFLVGYSIDFFSWIWAKVLPADLFTSMGVRIAVLIPALILFILAASFYMDVDCIVIDEVIYSFNYKFEDLLNMEKTMQKVKNKALEKIIALDAFEDKNQFKQIARAYKSPRTFITLKDERVNRIKNKANRKDIANMLNIEISSNGKFVFKNEEEVSLLLRYLCFKVFKDYETKELLEANNVTKLRLN